MSIGTPEGLSSAASDHITVGQRRPKPSKADDRAAYDLVTRRDEETCVKCRRGGSVERDHRQNRMPGNTVPSNLQLLCRGCHQWKTEHPRDAVRQGWAVPRHSINPPSEWPARRWIRTELNTYREAWVLYFDTPRHGRLFQEINSAEAAARIAGGMF